MNSTISVLFRGIPLAMALLCFVFGGYVFLAGDDPTRYIAGPVVFFLGSICIVLYTMVSTVIRQIKGSYTPFMKFFLPLLAYGIGAITLIAGIVMAAVTRRPDVLAAGHISAGIGLIALCAAVASTASARYKLMPASRTETSQQPQTEQTPSTGKQKTLIIVTIVFAVIAWIWAIVLLARNTDQHFIAGSIMGGIACTCTCLIALVSTFTRLAGNAYDENEKVKWPKLALLMAGVAVLWGLGLLIFRAGQASNFAGYVLLGLGIFCIGILSVVDQLARMWQGKYPSVSRIPAVPVLTALVCLFLAAFLFEGALFSPKYFISARILTGLGAVCFALFPLVSILENGAQNANDIQIKS